MKRILLFVLLVMGFMTSDSYSQWTEIPQMPVELNWPMTAQLGGKIYVFGGVNSAGSKSVYTYTPGDASWQKLSVVMPKGKFAGYAAVVNGKIYIVGGLIISGTSYVADNTTYEFDPVAATFTAKKNIPVKLGYFAGAEVGGKIYVMGGTTSLSVADQTLIQVYDPATDTWTTSGTEAPWTSTVLAASTVLNGKIFVMGGQSTTSYLSDAWRGTPNGTDITWEQVGNLPEALTRSSAGVVNGKVVFTGGVGPTSPVDFSNTYIYNEATDEWETSYALPVSTYNAGQLVGSGTDLYFVGGYLNQRAFKFTPTATPQPSISIKTDPVFLNLNQNATKSITFSAKNFGTAPLTITLSVPASDQPWLSVSEQSLTIQPLETATFDITLASGTMADGLKKSAVSLVTNDQSQSSISIPSMLYVLPASVISQNAKVLLEEGTGDWCGYCPQGHEVAQSIKDEYGDDFLVLNYHGGSATEPYMITAGQNLINDMHIQGYPNASVQRWLFPGEPYQMTNRGVWADYVKQVFEKTPIAPISIKVLEYTFDKNSKTVHAKIEMQRMAMATDPTMTIRLTTVVSEDGVEAQQEDYRTPSPYWIDYTHDAIVRQMEPNEFGTKLTFPAPTVVEGNIIVPGDKVTQDVDFTLENTEEVTANSNITFIVNELKGSSTFGNILQVLQRPLEGSANAVKTSGNAVSFTIANYPNPATKSTKFTYSLTDRAPVSLIVRDVMGREVSRLVSNEMQDMGTYEADLDCGKLSNGTYFYTLTAGSQTLTQVLNVVK